MNKKFSTLLAGIMLASAFSVGAQTIQDKYEAGKSYLLGNATDGYLSIVSDPENANYGQLKVVPASAITDLATTNAALWTVSFDEGALGAAPKFTYVNKATGLILSVSKEDIGESSVKVGGTYSQWLNAPVTEGIAATGYALRSYYEANKVLYLAVSGGDVVVKDIAADATIPADALEVTPWLAKNLTLTADDLNTRFWTIDEKKDFGLSFDKDVTAGRENLFTASQLKAVASTNGYVKIQAVDKTVELDGLTTDAQKQAYIVVDTAYHVGTESVGQLIKLTYASLNEQGVGDWTAENNTTRLRGSYDFMFTYNPNEDELYIQSRAYVKKSTNPTNVDPATGVCTYWNTTNAQVADAYIRLALLSEIRELTFASQGSETAAYTNDDDVYGQNTTIKLGYAANIYQPTTLADGLYIIKRHATGRPAGIDGSYYVANLNGSQGWVAEPVNQDFDHMPAAQWYVKQSGSSATSPISIVNREFEDKVYGGGTYNQLFKAGNYYFFGNTAVLNGDTLEFIPVSKESKADKYLGYKHVTADEASVETYTFDYLHGLALDKGLNTPADKDSIVRVDETGEKAQFILVPVVEDDSYGVQTKTEDTGIANLVRNVYYIKAYDSSKWGGKDRYLVYDYDLKKYVMSEQYVQPFFLKENNCIEGDTETHYYALVEANLKYNFFDNLGNQLDPIVTDGDVLTGYEYVRGTLTQVTYSWSTYDYASNKVSVDDNTLDLTQGSLDDKFYGYQEIRTSAFAVEKDDSPLYRRFNGVVPGTNNAEANYGTEANAPLQLKFFRYNNDAEFLAENVKASNAYRDELKDNSISFLGVNNEYQFNESDSLSYTFYVDTAYVRNNTRMPQYMLAIRPQFVEGDTIWCQDPNHKTHADSLNCYHTKIYPSFTRAMYLFNAQDSIDNKNLDYQGKSAYGAQGYTRLAFIEAIHANDTLYILKDNSLKNDEIDFRNADLFANKIALGNNMHKNVVFQFRLIDDSNLRFLIESETEENGSYVKNSKLTKEHIAPSRGGWIKIQNGVPVIANFNSFSEAIAQAEIFDVTNEIEFAPTANEDIAVEEGVSVIAGNGAVTIQGAAGKTVVITNILGKAVANTVLTSDNQTIAVPAGVVAVAVEGEEAVKAIVK